MLGYAKVGVEAACVLQWVIFDAEDHRHGFAAALAQP
jgi:hypothetical protein